jgi:HK97 family phage major capsid protein
MNLADLREQRNKALADAAQLSKGDVTTSEVRTKFDAFVAEADQCDADIARLERIEAYEAEQRSCPAHRPQPGDSNDAEVRTAQVKASFRSYLATGQIESRDLTTANSGVIIPQLFNPQIVSAQKSFGEVYDIVNVLKTDHGNPIRMAMDNDTTAGLVSVTVGTDAAEADPATSGLTLQVDNFSTGIIKVDMGLLTDAGFDVESWIRDKFAKRFFRGASNLIINGNGGAVNSLTAAYNAIGFTTAVTNKLTYADFATAIGTLDPAYQANAVFGMSNATLAYVIGLSDSTGRPLFLPDYGSASQGFVGTILGKRVRLITQLPGVATGNVPVLFGDFSEGYTFRQQNPGLGILRLNERFAAGYEVGFVGFARVGGVATDAGTHPVIGITIK